MANLIAYFSHTGENYFGGSLREITKGNTERVAEFVQQATGGDLFEIKTIEQYPNGYEECCDVAKAELQANARPELAIPAPDVSGYDTIFLGYPCWWGSCPMAVFTFLDQCDLTGNRILPFCTHEGSGLGGSELHLKKAYPQADILPGLAITGSRAADSQSQVDAWVKKVL